MAIIDLLLISVLAFIPFWFMGLTGIWSIHDVKFDYYFTYPIERLPDSVYVWNRNFAGWLDLVSMSIIHLLVFFGGLILVGIPTSIVQRIWLFIGTLFAGLGMYYLINTIFPYQNRSARRVACITASVFYMINPYIAQRIYLGAYPLWDRCILPFTFAFLFKGLKFSEEGRTWFKYAVLTAFSSTILLTAHYEIMIIIVAFLAVYVVARLLHDLSMRKIHVFNGHVKFLFATAFSSIALNLWWILPLMHVNLSGYVTQAYEAPHLLQRLESISGYPNIMIQNLRLQLFHSGLSYPWHEWLISPLSISISLVLLGLISLSIVLKPKNKHVLFFILTTVIFVGFSTGLNPPFGQVFLWLWDHFSIFRVLSEPTKLLHVVAFTYAILLGVSTADLYRRLSGWRVKSGSNKLSRRFLGGIRRVSPKAMSCVIMLLILLNSYPLLFRNFYGVLEPMHVPNYYFEASKWLNQQEGDFRIMPIPVSWDGKVIYSWNPTQVVYNVEGNIFTHSVLHVMRRIGEPANFIYNSIVNNQTIHAGKMLSLFDVKYVMVADDRLAHSSSTGERIETTSVKTALSKQEDIKLVKRFGDLYFYENTAYKDSLIYGSTTYIILPELGWGVFKLLIEDGYLHPTNAAIFLNSQLPEQAEIVNKAINIDQLTHTNWTTVTNADGPNGWKAIWQSSFTVDHEDYVKGNGSLRVVSNAPNSFPPSELTYLLYQVTGPQDWSDKHLISFWFKSDSVKPSYVFMLADVENNWYAWNFRYSNSNTWQQIVLPLNPASVQSPTPPDLTKVNKFKIQVYESTPAINTTYKVDIVQLGKIILAGNLVFKESRVDLSYEKTNPTKYIVSVKTEKPFILAFSESYDSLWEARIVGNENTVLDHFIVNGYANGWYANKTGKYTIVLEYKLQQYLYLGATFSMLSTIALIALIIFQTLKTKERSR